MKTAVVVGAGPAGLKAADVLSAAGVAVTVADQMPSVGRKFLMAGKSGLNLTKSEDPAIFRNAFGTSAAHLGIDDFGAAEVMRWAEDLGQPLFTGSTGRVFPVAMKASPLLRAWLARLTAQGVTFNTRWRWTGWDGDALMFATPQGAQRLMPDATVLALGGASWRKLGSDGNWAEWIENVAPFKPANMGFRVNWSDHMAPFFGEPVKATALHAGDTVSRGEWVITKDGMEGGGVYAVSATVRDGAPLTVDLLPDVPDQLLCARVGKRRSKSTQSHFLKHTLKLPPVKAALYQEFTKGVALGTPDGIVAMLRGLPIRHAGPMPLDQAISTAGGLRFAALDGVMLRDHPNTFAAGEMLDWEAPTGGYLITGCLASGQAAGLAALVRLQG